MVILQPCAFNTELVLLGRLDTRLVIRKGTLQLVNVLLDAGSVGN